MTTPQYDPKGLEAAALLANALTGRTPEDADGASMAKAVLTAYHEAIEPDGWSVEWCTPRSWSDARWTREQAVNLVRRFGPSTCTGRIRALYPGPIEEVKSDG